MRTSKIAKVAVGMVPPEGWTAVVEPGYLDAYGELWKPGDHNAPKDTLSVRLARTVGDLTVTLALNLSALRTDKHSRDWDRERAYQGVTVEGHTIYNGRTFTRVGVDCNSCALRDTPQYGGEYATVAALCAGEWDRCAAAHARSQTAVAVPGLPFNVQPEWFAKSAGSLRAGKPVNLMPAGFGTGYRLTTRQQSRWAKRADAALEAKLAVGTVYVETFDCD